ncbi:MAG: sulfatase-like hydrolase/transferase, partial [Elusimicrobiota bacterium]
MKSGVFGQTLFILITPFLLFLGIRGGIQQIPIQQSDAYFSKHNVLNLAAVNSGWNLAQSIIENKKVIEKNPFQYYPFDEAKKIVQELHNVKKDTTINILNPTRNSSNGLKTNLPNIVLIILEGWSGDLVKSLGGYDSITPNLEKLISEGILFENIYAGGSWSDHGISAIFSAFPAPPMGLSIIAQPNKYIHLPCISEELKNTGYNTSFLFGGQLSYGNIKAYLYYNKFDKIIEGKDFD